MLVSQCAARTSGKPSPCTAYASRVPSPERVKRTSWLKARIERPTIGRGGVFRNPNRAARTTASPSDRQSFGASQRGLDLNDPDTVSRPQLEISSALS